MKRFKSLMIILAIYVVAFGGAYFVTFLNLKPLLSIFIYDLVATFIIWITTIIFKNSSIYDPYWSVFPALIGNYIFFKIGNYSLINIVFLIVINIYSIRLTVNWCINFYSFEYEDWRYKMFRENNNKFVWHLINFFGIQYVPTLVVFFALIPMFVLFTLREYNPLSFIGILIIVFGILMELMADIDMHKFLKTTKEKKVCKVGLWKYSRHPNYLGELSIWIGTFVTMVISAPQYWYLGIGMILMICLFLFISIPMMEKRQLKRRPDYAEYKKTTSVLLLLPNKKLKN